MGDATLWRVFGGLGVRRIFLSIGLSVAVGGSALAASVVTNPDWLRRPDGDTIAEYFPEEATDRTISGKATVICAVRVDTTLADCKLVSERPAGIGFGEAAVRMATREFRMKPQMRDGKPVEGAEVRIPLVFILGSGSARYVILDPVWAQAPTFDDLAKAWPAEAGDLPSGTTALRCRLAAEGDLRNCIVAGGIPKNGPFGKAALTLVDRFKMKMSAEEAAKYARSDVIVSFHFLNPATPAGQAKKVVKPEWISRIDPKKIVALYPKAAADKGVTSGVGVADCLVAADGRLTDCKVAREDPVDLGFGLSAVAVAGITQMNPWTPNGRPVQGARVRLPITFNLAPEPEAAAEEAGQ